ncbi:MAG: PEGA domain-containing protein [Deltaproteobacteria bacterium]|nr:PEGA domain-containing protein [Deltaproteobacteria bacterium]
MVASESSAPKRIDRPTHGSTDDGRSRSVRPTRAQLIGLAAFAAGVGMVALLASRWVSLDGEPSRLVLTVTSEPSGARIVVDGVQSEQRTPAEVRLKPEGISRVTVERQGFVANPPAQSVQTPLPSTSGTSIHFELKAAGRGLTIRTEPPGATVAINGIRQRTVTPIVIEALAAHETATVAVSMDGYLPVQWLVTPGSQSSTTAHMKLEPAASIDVTSEPNGARVLIDGAFRGETPLYDVQVPKERHFTLEVRRRGFGTWRKRLGHASFVENAIQVVLEPTPLLAMPLSEAERVEALEIAHARSALDKKLANIERKLRAFESKRQSEAKRQRKSGRPDTSAERTHAGATANPQAGPDSDSDAEGDEDVDDATATLRRELFELRAQRSEQEARSAALRERALSRPEAPTVPPPPAARRSAGSTGRPRAHKRAQTSSKDRKP